MAGNMTPIESWFKIDGDNTLRLNYPLNAKSYVIDLGGYRGDWTAKIHSKFGCRVDVYEPVWKFYDFCRIRFEDVPEIKVFNSGVGKRNGIGQITLLADGSSAFKEGAEVEIVRIKDIYQIVKDKVDLLKINVEGAEYDILERLIETGKIMKVENIQVQFHPWGEDYLERYKTIQLMLGETHKITYNFPFVWENWRIK